MQRHCKIGCWLLILTTLAAFGIHAGELAVGDAVPDFSAKDQFGQMFQLQTNQKALLVGFDMTASKTANQKLAQLEKGWLEAHQAAYLLDIHTMPAIARVFALPKMRHYPERIVLIQDEQTLAAFPRQPERITILILSADKKIQQIRYWDPATQDIAKLLE
jgi:hypothetical protein